MTFGDWARLLCSISLLAIAGCRMTFWREALGEVDPDEQRGIVFFMAMAIVMVLP